MGRRRARLAWSVVVALVVSPYVLSAATYDFKVLLDTDNSVATGCSSVLPNGSEVTGIDGILNTAVTVDDTTGVGRAIVASLASCHQSLKVFGQPTVIAQGPWAAAGPNLAVETRASLQQLSTLVAPAYVSGTSMRLAFVVIPATGTGGDAVTRRNDDAILYPPPSRGGRRRAVGPVRTIVLDGKTLDWAGVAALKPDIGAFRGAIRLSAVFMTLTSDSIYFRFDANPGSGTFKPTPEVFPTTGRVPLTVTFITKAEHDGVQILRYRWDFDGDGIFDTNDPGAKNYTRTFTTPGVRNAVLEIMNERNQLATTAIPITVSGAPPEARATISPTNGPVPLAVSFVGTATAGSAPIALYEWDFEGDGRFDHSSTTSGTASFTYNVARTYQAVFRVTDSAGLRATASATATAVRAGPPGSPTARITSPSGSVSRSTPAVVSFSGSGSTPSGTITKYEWDYEGDGIYDYSSATNPSAIYTYSSPGTYMASFRVTNSAGLTAVDTIAIAVSMQVRLTLSSDTLRPSGSINVGTTLLGTAPVTLFIRDRSGRTIRTLVRNVKRGPGVYSDVWNGATDSGAPVGEGVYYAILEYLANGEPVTFDLSKTTGDTFYNPPWTLSTKKGTCQACIFAPYEDDFLQATFKLDKASEVTVSIRAYDSANEIAPLFDRRLFGSGRDYTVAWDGTDAKGQLVHPEMFNEDQFIFGMTAFTLPDNAIFVELAPEITEVAITPNYYDPFTTDFLNPQRAPALVEYNLSKAASLRLQVFRVGTNVALRTVDRPNAPAGKGSMAWDGRNDRGIFADKGDYHLALTAIDAAGNQSLIRYGLMKVYY